MNETEAPALNVGKRKYRIRYYQERQRKKSRRQSTTSQPAAGSHGSLFLWTSLNFRTVNILSLRARGELWRRSKLAQIRRRAPDGREGGPSPKGPALDLDKQISTLLYMITDKKRNYR